MDAGEKQRLGELHAGAAAACRAGCRTPGAVVSREGLEFLGELGIDAQCLYDYADDFVRYGAPSREAFAAVAEIRAAHFRGPCGGKAAPAPNPGSELPPKAEAFGGVPWLPRIIRKAQWFLEGSLPAEIMYGCSGDRAFLDKFGTGLPEFLSLVRDSGGNPAAVLAALRGQ